MTQVANQAESVKDGPATFAENAEKLRRAGWAVAPASGKAPVRAGFPTWKRAPGQRTVEQWAKQMPHADIVLIPGLSRTEDDCEVVTLDADDMEASEFVERTFGHTPGRTRTRKGLHHHFKLPAGVDLGTLHGLRDFGLNIDVKHGQRQAGIVVAPPSIHPDDTTFAYAWDGCDETVIQDLPSLDVAKLFDITQGRVASKKSKTLHNATIPPARPAGTMRDGSRGQWINDRLCSQAPWCDTLDEVLDCAFTLNAALVREGMTPLPPDEVMKRAAEVWKAVEAGKLVRTSRSRAVCTSDADEVRELDDAEFRLLMLFRAEHGARLARGETFMINIEGMVKAKTLGNWSARKYREARDGLVATGHLVCVKPARFRQSAEFTLVERQRTQSIDLRSARAAV